MVKTPAPYQNLEEFMISGNLKEPVRLSLEKDSLELYEVQSSLKDTLRIRRSGWGYLRAEVTVEGDFLEVEKKVSMTAILSAVCMNWNTLFEGNALERGKTSAGSGSKRLIRPFPMILWHPRGRNSRLMCHPMKRKNVWRLPEIS